MTFLSMRLCRIKFPAFPSADEETGRNNVRRKGFSAGLVLLALTRQVFLLY
jgi:hypothetical protein